MAEGVGLDINIRFANLKEEFSKLSKAASKSIFGKPGQYQAGISKALDELPSIMIRTKAQNEKMFNAFFKNVYSKLKGLFPDLNDKELNKLSTSFANQGVKLIRKSQAQEIKDEQNYWAKRAAANEKAQKKAQRDEQAYWAKVGNVNYKWAQLTEEEKQAKKGEIALKNNPAFAEMVRQSELRYEAHQKALKEKHKYDEWAKETPEEASRADWEHYQEKEKREQKESKDKEKREKEFNKLRTKDEKERQKRILMFLGKWNLYGISGRAVTHAVSSVYNAVNQVSQEALSWRRLGELGIASEGFGRATAQAQQAGLGKNVYSQFLKYLQAQKGALKLGEGNQALAWLFQLSPDTQTAEEMAQQIIDRLKSYPEDIALHLGRKAGLSEDFIAEARSGRLESPAPFGGYSKEAIETYAQLAESINKLTTSINVLAYNQGAGILKAFMDTVKGNAGGFFNPVAFAGNYAKQKIQATFKDVIVKITDNKGTERTLTGTAETSTEGQMENENLATMQQIMEPPTETFTLN